VLAAAFEAVWDPVEAAVVVAKTVGAVAAAPVLAETASFPAVMVTGMKAELKSMPVTTVELRLEKSASEPAMVSVQSAEDLARLQPRVTDTRDWFGSVTTSCMVEGPWT
jgi:hypothetical protein